MTTNKLMRAITVEGGKGASSALKIQSLPIPIPGEGHILIRVHSAGVNRPDVFQRLGLYPPPPGASPTLGLEVAGSVVVGAGRWKAGDEVCALVPGGGYAEYVTCDARHALPLPKHATFEEAAGLPETVFTVYANVFEDGRLQPGETLLLHGATSGVGVMAIQMAKAQGARVIATARSAGKAAAARAFGADVVVDTSHENFADVCRREGGADVILNMVGGDYFARDMESLKSGGRMVFIAALGGAEVALPIIQVMQKRAVITGSTLRGRSDEEKARLAQEVERLVWPWIESDSVRVKVDQCFPLHAASDAHARMESGLHVGKLILQVA
jgi:NADPH:quinone reductase